ncbi:MAG: reverse transcriptase domain-containing protein, partial [Gammaproteobacteria bacterium]|nr:reverse transcriptase domain-containing protein [Gammaproteobacteria bacterium]
MDKEIRDMLDKKAISKCWDREGFFSSVFLVPKKDKGWRPIINLKALNQYLKVQHFKMETINNLRDILKKGDWMGKIDLKDAYLTVPISPQDQKFLRFRWREQAYQCTALPFGLATAPRVFSKIMRPWVTLMREKGVRMIQYLDDILIMASTKEQFRAHMKLVMETLQSLGFIVNRQKSIVEPQQIIEFLGFVVNSLDLEISLPKSKVQKVMKEGRRMLNKKHITVRDLSHLIGLLNSTAPAVLPAPLHYRALQRTKNKALRENGQRYNSLVRLDADARRDLEWWTSSLQVCNGRPIIHKDPSMTIESDASKLGWGAHCQDIQTGGPWTREEARYHINTLELKAAFLALQTFAGRLTHSHILLLMDNRTAIAFINRKGGTHSKELSDLACNMWGWCLKKHLTIHAQHIPGKMNIRADYESRVFRDYSNWKLDKGVFNRTQKTWGPFSVDLFAARNNTQLP